jgi:hypothetical protein
MTTFRPNATRIAAEHAPRDYADDGSDRWPDDATAGSEWVGAAIMCMAAMVGALIVIGALVLTVVQP